MRGKRTTLVAAAAGLLLWVGGTPASAQAADTAAFCAARGQLGPSASNAAMRTALGAMADNAPGDAVESATDLEALHAKKGAKTFRSNRAFALLTAIDRAVYENCPGTALAVTATDYEFDGIPADIPAGPVKVQLANAAPEEEHELVIARLLPAGEGIDPLKLFKMPDKKAAKFVDFDSAVFTGAPAGEMGYTVTELEPGQYVYACFVPVGGTRDGEPHFMQGMYGTFTVS